LGQENFRISFNVLRQHKQQEISVPEWIIKPIGHPPRKPATNGVQSTPKSPGGGLDEKCMPHVMVGDTKTSIQKPTAKGK